MATYRISAGTTESQKFQAQVDSAVTDFTGSTLELLVYDRYGVQVTPITSLPTWDTIATGIWQYVPDGQLTKAKSPYTVRLAIDILGEVLHSPNEQGGGADAWYIVSP